MDTMTAASLGSGVAILLAAGVMMLRRKPRPTKPTDANTLADRERRELMQRTLDEVNRAYHNDRKPRHHWR